MNISRVDEGHHGWCGPDAEIAIERYADGLRLRCSNKSGSQSERISQQLRDISSLDAALRLAFRLAAVPPEKPPSPDGQGP